MEFAVAGGYAVALHGGVRGTIDLDLVVAHSEPSYVAAERALNGLGLRCHLPVGASEVFRFRQEYLDNRNLVAWSFVDPNDPTRLVDIVLTFARESLPTTPMSVAGETIPVLEKSALIAMKERAGRAQDMR